MKRKNKYSRIHLIKLLIILYSVSAMQFSCSSSDNNNSDIIDMDCISKIKTSTKEVNNTVLSEEIQGDGKEPVDIHFTKFIGNASVNKLRSIDDFEEAINNTEFETIDESDFFKIFNFEINHSVEISNPKILAYYSHNDTTKLWLVKTDGDVHCPEDFWLIHTGENDFYYHKKINIRTFCLGDMQPCSEFGRTGQGNIFLKTGAAYYSLDSTRYGVPFGHKIYTKTCIYDINLNLLKTDSINSGSNKNNTNNNNAAEDNIVKESQVEFSEFTDKRNNRTYKTIKIGNKIWMAENLDFETENSWCYNNEAETHNKLGRLYTYEAAEKACPSDEGWRIPTNLEWYELIEYFSDDKNADIFEKGKNAGIKLLKTGNSGFNIIFAGMKCANEDRFLGLDSEAHFWCAWDGESMPLETKLTSSDNILTPFHIDDLDYALSVRCIKSE